MTLQEFRAHLQDLDKLCGWEINMFDCGAKEIGPNRFTYSFDALCYCVWEIRTDGSVREICETALEDITDTCGRTWTSIDAWKLQLIREVGPGSL